MSEETIFHKIAKKEIPATIVFENENVVAFKDLNPIAPLHILIVPKHKTIPSLNEIEKSDTELLGEMLLVAKQIAYQEKIAESGYRVVINCGKDGGQTVFQLHMHLIGGTDLSKVMM